MEAFELSIMTMTLLLLAALIAGFIDTLVGGGGLITLPALMVAGVPPMFALGTNKLQSAVGTGTASLSMFRRQKVRFEHVNTMMATAFIGSLLGSTIVQFFDAKVLNVVIPLVIGVIAVYFVLAPTQALTERAPSISKSKYTTTAVPAIGFYDGMFGPGTGSFFVLAGVTLQGQHIVNATVVAKTLNFATNFAALLIFIWFGKVLWAVGGLMMLGQYVGASLGARALLKINPIYLRCLVIGVCFLILSTWGINNYA
ncbi:MAG: putative membrane protein YfcA [Cryomorphaceae bacterium]|jgi:uncharacterized membrane protein YfcA